MQPIVHREMLAGLGGGEVQTIDVTSSNRRATFKLEKLKARVGNAWCYLQKLRVYIRTQIDQPGSTNVITPDWLYSAIENIKLSCDDLGVLYSEGDLTGPQLGLVAQIVSNKYALPSMLGVDVPNTDSDNARTIIVDIPIGHRCFKKGHQTGIWNGFWKNNGILEVNLAASTWPATASAGAAAEATTDVRVEAVYTVEQEARIPTIWKWIVRNTPASETQHMIKNMCQGSGIKGSMGVGKLAFLGYLGNVRGLGGAGTVGNITRVLLRDRGMESFNLSTPFFGHAPFLAQFIEETRYKNIFPSAQAQCYPFVMGNTLDNFLTVGASGALAFFLPYFWPDPEGQDASKLQEVGGDYYVEHDYTATPAAQAKWISLEQSYLSQAQEEWLMGQRMGLNPSQYPVHVKVDKQNDPGNATGVANQQRKYRGIPKKIRGVA
jgi:hypothetical protein